MERNTFIITVYGLVSEICCALTVVPLLCHGGFTPELNNEEVLTMESYGELRGNCTLKTNLCKYFRAPLALALT